MNHITCPMCSKRLLLQFKPKVNIGTTHSMARFYWYCFDCKLSVQKTLTNDELINYVELKNESRN